MNICKDVGVTKIGVKKFRRQFLTEFLTKTQKNFKVHKSEGFLDVNPPSTLTTEQI